MKAGDKHETGWSKISDQFAQHVHIFNGNKHCKSPSLSKAIAIDKARDNLEFIHKTTADEELQSQISEFLKIDLSKIKTKAKQIIDDKPKWFDEVKNYSNLIEISSKIAHSFSESLSSFHLYVFKELLKERNLSDLLGLTTLKENSITESINHFQKDLMKFIDLLIHEFPSRGDQFNPKTLENIKKDDDLLKLREANASLKVFHEHTENCFLNEEVKEPLDLILKPANIHLLSEILNKSENEYFRIENFRYKEALAEVQSLFENLGGIIKQLVNNKDKDLEKRPLALIMSQMINNFKIDSTQIYSITKNLGNKIHKAFNSLVPKEIEKYQTMEALDKALNIFEVNQSQPGSHHPV